MTTVTFFSTIAELRALTGLPGDNYDRALWDAGFNLDDWDWGFVSDIPWGLSWDQPYYVHWMLSHMAGHCVGFEEIPYGGKYYYILYHS